MKMMIPLVDTPNHKFDGVARSIAQGAPPKWLVLGLTQFSQGIGVDTSDADNTGTVIEEMQDAAHVLMRRLPIYKHLGFGLPCPEEVTVVLQALPRIKEDLDRLAELNSRIGRRPDAQALMCAAVVARAWKIIHGPPKPSSVKLLEACSDYWRACGGKGKWDLLENWRRPVKRVLEADYFWIERVLLELAVQNSH